MLLWGSRTFAPLAGLAQCGTGRHGHIGEEVDASPRPILRGRWRFSVSQFLSFSARTVAFLIFE